MASALEHYVNHVRTLSAAGNYRELTEYLNVSIELLSKNSNILENVLETLDIQQHSLGVLYVLVAKFSDASLIGGDMSSLFRTINDFINLSNGDQLRFAPTAYFELFHHFTSYLMKNKLPTIQGLNVLESAIEKIRLFDSQLTPIHSDLCQLSLCSKVFNSAIKFLDIDITAITNTDDVNQDTKYFLLYYYYGGMIYTACKNYDRALYFFEVAVSAPALSMSHIMLESYKKYILVSLILNGKIQPIPKYSSQVISRFMKPLSYAYHDLATAFLTTSREEVLNIVNKYREIYVRDTNMGLVKQVISSLYKKNIQRLTKSFITLSLSDVASRVQLSGSNEAEKYILDMIKSGEMYASINQRDKMVEFIEDPEKYNSPGMFLKVQDDMSNVMELNKKIMKMEEEIIINPLFVKKSIGTQDDEVLSAQHSKNYVGDPTE